jgi:hypothetical protein
MDSNIRVFQPRPQGLHLRGKQLVGKWQMQNPQ